MRGNPDAKLDFGSIDLSGSAADLSNVLDLDKTTAGGLFVALRVTTAGAGGTSAAISIKGSSDGTNWTELSSITAVVASGDLALDKNLFIGIPVGDKSRYLKVSVSKTGTFTAGELSAYLDTYRGK